MESDGRNDGLQEQISDLKSLVVTLDHTVRGNGQPGLKSDLAAMKERVEHIAESMDDVRQNLGEIDDRIVKAIEKGLALERERIQRSLKDTGEIQAIVFPIINRVADEKIEKFKAEQEAEKKNLEKERSEKESAPGSWRYFVEHYWMPILMMIIGMLLSNISAVLETLLNLK